MGSLLGNMRSLLSLFSPFFNLPFQLFLIVGGFMPIHRFFSPRHDGQILGVIRAATITVLWHTYIGKII